MNELTKYLKTVFNLDLKLKPLPDPELSRLPLYLKTSYQFWYATLFKNLVFLKPKGELELTPAQYRKQAQLLENKLGFPVIFVFAQLKIYIRNRLIQQGVSFVIPGKQIFIPEIFVDLKDYLKVDRAKQNYLQPAAQLLLFYHILKDNLHDKNYQELTRLLHYPYRTVARAIENLLQFELIDLTNTKVKRLNFKMGKQEVWNKALGFLSSPVIKSGFVNKLPENARLYKTNTLALSHYTLIAEDDKKQLALFRDDFIGFKKKGFFNEFNNYDGDFFIEVWKYNPGLLMNSGFVDPLSLFLIFRDSNDERIQIAIDQMLEDIKW